MDSGLKRITAIARLHVALRNQHMLACKAHTGDEDQSPAQVLDFAQVDSWRAQRTGFPEVVLGAGKSAEQIAAIMRQLAQNEQVVMATRVSPEARHCPILKAPCFSACPTWHPEEHSYLQKGSQQGLPGKPISEHQQRLQSNGVLGHGMIMLWTGLTILLMLMYRAMQVYTEVLPLLPEVQYNARARILTLRALGSRKQPRLPGLPPISAL